MHSSRLPAGRVLGYDRVTPIKGHVIINSSNHLRTVLRVPFLVLSWSSLLTTLLHPPN